VSPHVAYRKMIWFEKNMMNIEQDAPQLILQGYILLTRHPKVTIY
jgi:hypothetical protein